jgi:hypothetical protein
MHLRVPLCGGFRGFCGGPEVHAGIDKQGILLLASWLASVLRSSA